VEQHRLARLSALLLGYALTPAVVYLAFLLLAEEELGCPAPWIQNHATVFRQRVKSTCKNLFLSQSY
jgi:hypothetical protein